MQIVIEIPEELYKAVMACKDIPSTNEGTIDNVLTLAVENGTPLPKGHGRLIDADALHYHEIDEIGGEYNPYLGCSKPLDEYGPMEMR